MATQPLTLVTAEQFYQLPQEAAGTHGLDGEGREFELLDGEVVEASSATYEHGLILIRSASLLYPALRGRGEAVYNTDFSDGKYTILRPDLAVLLGEKCALIDLKKLPVTVPPDIVMEVISASESAFRVERRKDAYLRFGAHEVWLFYSENRHIYVHTPAGVNRLRSGDTLQSPLLPDWSVPVDRLFER
jgi:Uma2 family endonuclease